MKIRMLVFILISVLAVIALIGGCATTKKALSEEDFFKTWSGTWVNTDFPGSHIAPQKIITYPDGTLDFYSTAENPNSSATFIFTLFDRWIDSDGNTWFKARKRCNDCEITIYEFGKLNNSGDTYELLYHVGSGQIKDWEPDNPLYNYVVYYRQ